MSAQSGARSVTKYDSLWFKPLMGVITRLQPHQVAALRTCVGTRECGSWVCGASPLPMVAYQQHTGLPTCRLAYLPTRLHTVSPYTNPANAPPRTTYCYRHIAPQPSN